MTIYATRKLKKLSTKAAITALTGDMCMAVLRSPVYLIFVFLSASDVLVWDVPISLVAQVFAREQTWSTLHHFENSASRRQENVVGGCVPLGVERSCTCGKKVRTQNWKTATSMAHSVEIALKRYDKNCPMYA